MSTGTSNPVSFTPIPARNRYTPAPVTHDGVDTDAYGKPVTVKPPRMSDNMDIVLSRCVNAFPDFAFDKVSAPSYGVRLDCIARYNGIPVNEPDFIADYHLIALMRLSDRIVKPQYSGKIVSDYDGPDASS